MTANPTVVDKSSKGKSVNLHEYLFIRKDSPRFTTLTKRQQEAVKKIENYWINRTRNYKNWKTQKHWSYKTETISIRIERNLNERIKNRNNSLLLRNFIRQFLIDDNFRKSFIEQVYKTEQKDWGKLGEIYPYLDTTDKKTFLMQEFPFTISSKILVIEKELFTFYFTFLSETSITYALRTALKFYKNLSINYKPIMKEDVPNLMLNLINTRERWINEGLEKIKEKIAQYNKILNKN